MLSTISFHSPALLFFFFAFNFRFCQDAFCRNTQRQLLSTLLLVFVLFSPAAKAFKSCLPLPWFIMSSWILYVSSEFALAAEMAVSFKIAVYLTDFDKKKC